MHLSQDNKKKLCQIVCDIHQTIRVIKPQTIKKLLRDIQLTFIAVIVFVLLSICWIVVSDSEITKLMNKQLSCIVVSDSETTKLTNKQLNERARFKNLKLS